MGGYRSSRSDGLYADSLLGFVREFRGHAFFNGFRSSSMASFTKESQERALTRFSDGTSTGLDFVTSIAVKAFPSCASASLCIFSNLPCNN